MYWKVIALGLHICVRYTSPINQMHQPPISNTIWTQHYDKKIDMEKKYNYTLFRPAQQNLTQVIKNGYLATCTKMTDILTPKHPHPYMEIAKEHMHQTRKNVQSTKTTDHTQQY